MTSSSMIPAIDILKQQAKSLRAEQASGNNPISHSRSLELVAHQLGYRDWNTLRAASENQTTVAVDLSCPVAIGDRISGLYLGQPFTAEILNLVVLEARNLFRITMHFDEAVDVVTHQSFSSFRQRVSGNIDSTGKTLEKTSNGVPQIQIHVGDGK
jgi:hypothetical protein